MLHRNIACSQGRRSEVVAKTHRTSRTLEGAILTEPSATISDFPTELPPVAPAAPEKRDLSRLRRRLDARQLLRALRQRSGGKRRRRKKRKLALALSASTVGFGTAGMVPPPDAAFPATAVEDQAELRLDPGQLSASDRLREAMIEEEGSRRRVYRDVAGRLTVGIGHLVRPSDRLFPGEVVSHETILDLFEDDLAIAERAARRIAGDTPLYQHEFDALVDLVFNVGEGNLSADRSPRLNRAIATADYDAIADELHYTSAGGAVAKGLVYRSERRANIFESASYEDPRERA